MIDKWGDTIGQNKKQNHTVQGVIKSHIKNNNQKIAINYI